jgi:AraC family transcriptional regulator of adaptative response/methylated-DNA-[protein]-cysteine methyltransferase
VAATDRGVCAVSLGDSDTALESSLRREFPHAAFVRADEGLAGWIAAAAALADGAATRFDAPIDVRATVFQERVWGALRQIPRGEVRSYAEVAASIGRPGAARAVARACASNRLALVTPCHRVTASGGAVGGYRWGADRKARIIEAERSRRPAAGRSRAVSVQSKR